MVKPIIEVINLSYAYPNGSLALMDVDLTVMPGEFLAIIGQNGAGKSTLLKNITGLIKPTKGEIKIDGEPIADKSVAEMSTSIGFVLQNPDSQLFAATVNEEVAFGPKNLGFSEEEIEERVQDALKKVELADKQNEFPSSLSKGERAKVVIASVVAMRPRVIILDEPTSGQDYRGCYQIMDIVKQLNETGITVLMVTHHMALVAEYARRAVVLCKGRVLLDAPVEKVFSEVDVLSSTHLKPPQITRVGRALSLRPANDKAFLRVEELGDHIVNIVGGRV